MTKNGTAAQARKMSLGHVGALKTTNTGCPEARHGNKHALGMPSGTVTDIGANVQVGTAPSTPSPPMVFAPLTHGPRHTPGTYCGHGNPSKRQDNSDVTFPNPNESMLKIVNPNKCEPMPRNLSNPISKAFLTEPPPTHSPPQGSEGEAPPINKSTP